MGNLFDQFGMLNGGNDVAPPSYADTLPAWAAEHSSLNGFAAAQRENTARHNRRVLEAARLYADVLKGRLDPVFWREAIFPKTAIFVEHLAQRYPGIYGDVGGRNNPGRYTGLRETMSVTDYQALYVDVLDRIYYGFYNAYPIVNKGLVKLHTLRDFRVVSRYLLDGVVTPLTATDPAALPLMRALVGPSPQDGTYPANNTAPIQYQPKLYQAMTSVNWRAIVNDDLGIFKDLSRRLAIAGNRGISQFITSFYTDANGPNANLYKTGYGNQILVSNGSSVNNPAFGAQGVMDALKVLARMRDSSGQPILMTGRLRCWYGPANVAAAQNLKNALTISMSVEGGSQNSEGFPTQWLQTSNWISDMDLVMDPYIPIVCTTNGVQDTMWGITIDPESQERPNSEVGMLSGFDTPQLYTELPNTQRMGGGVDPTLGNFWTMNQNMKIITVMGGANIDGRSTVASTGQNS